MDEKKLADNKYIILASQSPRRRELMTLGGYEFGIITSDAEDKLSEDESKEDSVAAKVEFLASLKAQDVYANIKPQMISIGEKKVQITQENVLVIGADTVVAVDGKILGKPKDEQDAFDMLKLLSGRKHQVYTGVCIVESKDDVRTFHEKTDVEFYPMTDEEILSYIATKDPMDKAGAYGIQGGAAKFVKGITGDYNNVVGLPLARLYHELQENTL